MLYNIYAVRARVQHPLSRVGSRPHPGSDLCIIVMQKELLHEELTSSAPDTTYHRHIYIIPSMKLPELYTKHHS